MKKKIKEKKEKMFVGEENERRKVAGQTSECVRTVKPVKIDPAYKYFISIMYSQTKIWLDAY